MSSPPCRQDIALSRIADRPGYVDVMLTYQCESDVSELQPHLPKSARVKSIKGFSRSGQKCIWDGTTEMPMITFEMSVGEGGPAGRDKVDTGEWALLQAPQLKLKYQLSQSFSSISDLGNLGRSESFEDMVDRRYHVHDQGISSSDGAVMYLGPYDLHSRYAGGEEIQLVVPAAASLDENPKDILDAVEKTALDLDLRGAEDEVLGAAAPTEPVSWGPAGQKRGKNGFWVRDSSSLNKPNSTWIHEYIHTRQEFDVTRETMWLVEGTAVFFATYSAHQQGLISDADFQRTLNPSMHEGDVLSSPRQGWSSSHTPYKKGARVTAWLDRRIRKETDGKVGFDGVFRAMNLHEGQLTHEEFVEFVASSMGMSKSDQGFREVERDIESYVRGPDVPGTVGPPGSDPLPESEVGSTDPGVVIEDILEGLNGGDGTFDEGQIFSDENLDEDLFSPDDLFLGDS